MSRIRVAERSQVKLKIEVSGLSGSGKTYSSLLLAKGLTTGWDKVGLIDSENGSGELYSHLGPYKYIDIRYGADASLVRDPHSPESYISAIKEMASAGCEVIVIDSISHEWDGIGGCLESVERLGGKFSAWGSVTPRHKAFLDTILNTPVHIIATARKKSDYIIGEEEKNGRTRQKIEKVGLKDVQREGTEYEFTLQFTIDLKHLATAEKDRTGLFKNTTPFKLDEATGKELLKWSNSGRGHISEGNVGRSDDKTVVRRISDNPDESDSGSEFYTGDPDQKKILNVIFDAHNIQDKEKKRKAHENFLKMKVLMKDLNDAVREIGGA